MNTLQSRRMLRWWPLLALIVALGYWSNNRLAGPPPPASPLPPPPPVELSTEEDGVIPSGPPPPPAAVATVKALPQEFDTGALKQPAAITDLLRGEEISARDQDISSNSIVSNAEHDTEHETWKEVEEHLNAILNQIATCTSAENLTEKFTHFSKSLGALQDCLDYWRELPSLSLKNKSYLSLINSTIPERTLYEGDILSYGPESLQTRISVISGEFDVTYRFLYNLEPTIAPRDFPDHWAVKISTGFGCLYP